MKKIDNTTPRVLCYLLLAMFALTEVGLFFLDIPPQNKEVLLTMIQTLLTVTVGALGYFHGSSLGSREKDEKASTTPPGTTTTTVTPSDPSSPPGTTKTTVTQGDQGPMVDLSVSAVR